MVETKGLLIKKLKTRPTFNWGLYDPEKEEFVVMFNSKKEAQKFIDWQVKKKKILAKIKAKEKEAKLKKKGKE